jgi:hypothetical protein
MLSQKTVLIDGKELIIQQLGTTNALNHAIILGQLIGGVSQGVDSRGSTDVGDWFIDFGKMAEGVLSKLDSEESPRWIKRLIQQSLIKPTYSDDWYESFFSGNIDGLAELIKQILEHNYGGLFEFAKKKIEDTSTKSTSLTGTETHKTLKSTA